MELYNKLYIEYLIQISLIMSLNIVVNFFLQKFE